MSDFSPIIRVVIDDSEVDRIISQLGFSADKLVRRQALKVEQKAKMLAPIDTGALRNSIHTKTADGDNYAAAAGAAMGAAWKRAGEIRETVELPDPPQGVAYVGPAVEYGAYVEFGTDRWDGKPYLTPAADQMVRDFANGNDFVEIFGALFKGLR